MFEKVKWISEGDYPNWILRELQKVKEMCEENGYSFYNCFALLKKMCRFEVPPSWDERILKSKTFFKNDSSSLDSYICRYGEKLGADLHRKKTEQCTITKEKYLKKHSVKDWEELCDKKASNRLDRKTREEHQRYLKKWKKSMKLTTKIGRSNGLLLESFVERYGEEEGYRRWEKRRRHQSKRFSKEWYIDKYGEEEGKNRWNEYKARMAEMSKTAANKRNKSYSNVSQKLFKEIVAKLPKNEKDTVCFAEHGGEKIIDVDEDWGRWILVDFLYKNKVIEFDGRYWHSSPEIKERDAKKDLFLAKRGYEVLRIPEEDYENNRVATLKMCLNFLKGGER
jgi:hypothetical protein